jgi:DNA-binding transcriptional ArsR family regulator
VRNAASSNADERGLQPAQCGADQANDDDRPLRARRRRFAGRQAAETQVIAHDPLLRAVGGDCPIVLQACFDYGRIMKVGPNIAPIAALVGDPARSNMLTALMGGQALTATELAQEAGITPQTASSHLAKLQAGGLVTVAKQGRHRYFRLAGADVAAMIETLIGVADRTGHVRLRPGPSEPALRQARVCYDHLAGERGVQLFDSLVDRGMLTLRRGELAMTARGKRFVEEFGIDLGALTGARRPLCRTCLDWSVRRNHLAGALGAALLDRLFELKWAQRQRGTRAVIFNRRGEARFEALFAAGGRR